MPANWVWAIGPWAAGVTAVPQLNGQGGRQAELNSATSRSLRLKLKEPSTASFTVNGYSAEAQIVEELITDLWVYRNGKNLFRGRASSTSDDIDEIGRYNLAVDCVDYRGVLDRRIRWNDRTWTNVEQSQIVWDAITDMQAETGGSYGLTKGTWPVTGITRPSVVFKAGDTVWSLVKTLAGMSGGFDLDLDENLVASLYYPQRGKSAGAGAALDWGGAVVKVNRRFDPARYANGIRQSGADAAGTYFTTTPDVGTAREGRWEASYGDPQLNTADMVQQTAMANLTQASRLLPSYSLTLAQGAWGGPDHVWLGDYVTVVIKAGRLNEQVLARVHEINIDVDASDDETVTVVAGDLQMDPRSVLRGIARRVQVLSTR